MKSISRKRTFCNRQRQTETKFSSYNIATESYFVTDKIEEMKKEVISVEGKAVKFGGTSLCDAKQIQKASEIVRADPKRKVIVVSAPGKRTEKDEKITDLLIKADTARSETEREALFAVIENRFDEMIHALHLPLDFSMEYKTMRRLHGDALISRGEYFSARIFSVLLGITFLDAADCIFFRADGTLDETKTRTILSEKLTRAEKAVIPGFYGSMPGGDIRLFSRGGSDITGAIAADAMDADIYENFTDVSGFLLAEPKIVPNAMTVPIVSYRELRYLSAMGASVLHADAILPLRKKQIPVVIRNTNAPHGPHTWVVSRKEKGIGGSVGAVGYTMVALERSHIGDDPDAVAKILSILAAYGFAPTLLSHEPDSLNVLIRYCDYEKADKIAIAIQQKVDAEIVTVRGNIAEIAVAGEGFAAEMRAAVWKALEKANVRPCFAASVTESFSLVIGVSEAELSSAIRHIYEALVPFLQ